MSQFTLIKLRLKIPKICIFFNSGKYKLDAIFKPIFLILIEMEGVSEIHSRFEFILKIYLQKEILKFTWGNLFK